MRENELAGFSRRIALVDDVAVFIKLNVRLADNVFVLFPRRQIKRKRFVTRLPVSTHALVRLLDIFLRHVIAWLELCITAVSHAHKLSNDAVHYLAIWRFDETEFVDARIARQRRNQTDVRTFRRLDRTDAPIVSRMHVAHFESRALAAETTWSKCRETTLVRDFRQWVCLIHELRQLRRAEEFAHRRGDGLRVDEVARHRRLHLL